ncbi:MAG TPA: CBS domain-containing protein [Candidatus Lustribacter sp.]|nr:CBS domain-containing protein [Candidatus Lustribacter sp.]
MRISDVIRGKTPGVVTVRPDDTVTRLLAVLAEHRIGAIVVSEDGSDVAGIVSERDVVRRLDRDGAGILEGPVSAIMTTKVITCEPADSVETLAGVMTDQRIRHVPVLADGSLYAIVSIGDIVKHRMGALKAERDHLVGYIQQ